MKLSSLVFLPLFFLSTLPACTSSVLDGGEGGSGPGEPVPPTGASPAPAPPFDATTVKAVMAKCAEAQGAVATYDSVEDLSKLLVGAWLACPRQGETLGRTTRPGELGFEFVHDGSFHVLVDDGQGGVVRSTRLEDRGDYRIYPKSDAPVNNVSFQIDVTFETKSTMGTRATFSSVPRQMVLQLLDYWTFVPLG
jgi:hypothetical protein